MQISKTKADFLFKLLVYSLVVDVFVLFMIFLFLDLSYDSMIVISIAFIIASVFIVFLNSFMMKDIFEEKKLVKRDIKHKMDLKIKLKNRQRNDMISAIAHEFRNPISVIMGYAQTLNEDREIDEKNRIKFLGKIYDNSQRIETVLSRLILWNKFESKSAKLEISSFSIEALANEVIWGLKDKYINREIILNADNSIANADRLLISIVLQNLIENGLKYSSDIVKIDIENNLISVTDSGIGIKQKDKDLITKKFYRVSEHDWNNSMGIGLSIVKQILKLHKSELLIDSQESIGSSFSFVI